VYCACAGEAPNARMSASNAAIRFMFLPFAAGDLPGDVRYRVLLQTPNRTGAQIAAVFARLWTFSECRRETGGRNSRSRTFDFARRGIYLKMGRLRGAAGVQS
jgi:hypothetical protein